MARSERFEECIKFVLAHETEWYRDGTVRTERDPADPGGTTKYGIDQRSHPDINIAALTEEQAKEIYYKEYWLRSKCDQLGPPFDLAVFDAAVNLGRGWAIPALQKAVKTEPDGFIGPKTIAAVKDNPKAIEVYLTAREARYRSLRLSLRQRFLKGWLARVSDVRKELA